MARLKARELSKYNNFDPALPVPEPGYVLVIDQSQGDASITHGGATAATFREMLVFAQEENPGARDRHQDPSRDGARASGPAISTRATPMAISRF